MFDTWLSEEDIERVWRVTQGELSEDFTTLEELIEFQNVLLLAYQHKHGMVGQTLQ